MRCRWRVALGVLTGSLSVAPARADCRAAAPWDRIADSAQNFARPLPLALLGGAVLAPLVMVPSGVDHRLRLVAQDDLGGEHNLEPVSVAAPYFLVGGVLVGYGVSAVFHHCESQRVQAAVLQSAAITGATVLLLKWATGRQWPHAERDENDPASLRRDTSKDFEPFGQPYRAFPSGHTAILFAAASSFRASLPEDAWYRWLGYPLSVGVAAGMWLGDHHWASDIVSGGLLGEAIGSSVGRSFRGDDDEHRWGLLFTPDGAAVSWSGTW